MQQFLLYHEENQQWGMALWSEMENQSWYQIQLWSHPAQQGNNKNSYWAWVITDEDKIIRLERMQEWGWSGYLIIGNLNLDRPARIKQIIISQEDRSSKPKRPGKIIAYSRKMPSPPVWLPLPDPAAHPRQIIGVIWDERGEVKYLAHGIWGKREQPPLSQTGAFSPYRTFEPALGEAGKNGWGYWLMYWNPKTNQIVFLNR